MTMLETFRHPLLDPPLVGAHRLSALEDRTASLLGASCDVFIVGAEAVLPLEAITASLGGPELAWLNVVTSGYGRVFGELLRSRGAVVHDLAAPNDRPISVEEVGEALHCHPGIGAVAAVHAESLTGVLNPLPQILDLAAGRGALTVVDAVASAGAEPLAIDASGIDVCVVGPQKGWGGPAGASVVSVTDRAWDAMRDNLKAPRGSVLSLLDIKERWIEAGRARVIGTPPPLEITALELAVARLETEGIDAVVVRHQQTAVAVRHAVRALGLKTWVADEHDACSVATPVRVPDGIDANDLANMVLDNYGISLTPGIGDLQGLTVRIDHMGSHASFAYATAAVAGLAGAVLELGCDVDLAAAMAVMTASAI